MRLKILFFPFALIVSVVLLIWFISPEFAVIKNKADELNSEEKTLREVINKKQNLNSLEASLKSNADKESFVLNYLSSEKKEEEIVNTLDYLAISSGISLLDLAVADTKADKIPSISPVADSAENSEEALKNRSAVKEIEVELNLVGSYEGIKSFLNQVYKAEKANDIYFVNISRQPESDSLLADVKVNFSYLPQVRLNVNDGLNEPIFSQKRFEFAIVDDLINLASSKIPEIEIDSTGKANPFLP